jgi:hypothetical protein
MRRRGRQRWMNVVVTATAVRVILAIIVRTHAAAIDDLPRHPPAHDHPAWNRIVLILIAHHYNTVITIDDRCGRRRRMTNDTTMMIDRRRVEIRRSTNAIDADDAAAMMMFVVPPHCSLFFLPAEIWRGRR